MTSQSDKIHKNGNDCEYDLIGTNKGLGFGVRHVQAILMFLCLTTAYGMRVTLSLAVVAMTDRSVSLHADVPIFDWDKKTQGFVLSSFFWGYVTMQVPGSYIAHKYGAKLLLSFVMIANGCMSVLTPMSAQYAGWQAVCVCRILQGMFQGSLLPCLHSLQGKWLPISERGRLSTYVYGGSNCGTILAMISSGLMAGSSFGWPIIFYSTGMLSITFGVIWSIFGAGDPASHKRISNEEKHYIQKSLEQKDGSKPMRIPWIQILTHVPLWAIAVAHVGSSWTTLTLLTEMPSYMSKVMGINIKANGFLSSLPFVGMWVFSFVFSVISDHLINKGYFTLGFARKFANTLAMWGSCCGLIMLSFVPAKHVTLAVVLLVLTVSIKAAMYVGFHVNHIDISPNFSGTLMGVGNCFSNAFGTMAPIVAGFVLHDDRDVIQWRTVFFISAGICFFTNVFYLCFGSSEKAEWNEPDYFEKRKALKNLKNQEKEMIPLSKETKESI